jgi:signal transduction histidine kinase
VAIAIPLHINRQPIGLILMSEKQSQENFSSSDMSLIEVVGNQAISSIQKAKLYEGDQMKTEFVSIASHELLTPVSAIEGYLSMILDEHIGQVDDQAREYLTNVYTSAKRLSALIKDLLSVSRIESGRMKVVAQAVDLPKMIGEAVTQLKFTAKAKDLKLIYTPPTSCPPAWADPDRTMQIIVNLLSNAIKYTNTGTVTIKVSSQLTMGRVSVDVTDTGLGMDKEQQAHLFEKFYRVSSPDTTNIQGTGLGLYISKSMIEKMGGSISLHSVPGKGSTFTFTLPIFKVELSQPSGE